MVQEIKQKHILGNLPQALLGNFMICLVFWAVGNAFGRPQIYIEQTTANIIFYILSGFFILMAGWTIFTSTKNKISQKLLFSDPYYLVRHPMAAAIVWLLNPAIAILLRSWFLIFALIPIYFIWQAASRGEEIILAEKFSEPYKDYQNKTWLLFPNLWRINKFLFYSLTGLVIFGAVFVYLNFSAVYLRWVTYEPTHQKITYDNSAASLISPDDFQQMFESKTIDSNSQSYASANSPGQSQIVQAKTYKLNYNAQTNSITIPKINIHAPLVTPKDDSDKQLNLALNQGVIIYPGSVLPGQRGEVLLSGHSSIFPWVQTKYGQVFTLLDKVETGDIVSLVYNNLQYDYRITGKEILWPKDVRVISTGEPTIALTTCWPIGTTLKRLVVRGELIQ